MDARRIVHLDRTDHPADARAVAARAFHRRWEGGTLVVDTVGYAAHPDGFAFDLPSSASKHIVERFTLAADRKHVDYEIVVEDPEYLAAPVSHRAQWDYRPSSSRRTYPATRGRRAFRRGPINARAGSLRPRDCASRRRSASSSSPDFAAASAAVRPSASRELGIHAAAEQQLGDLDGAFLRRR